METAGAPARGRERPAFDTPNILWFFGAFTAAAAGEAVIGRIDTSARGAWMLMVSLAFLAAFALASALLLRAGWWVPGGVLAAMAVTFVAPAAGAFERLVGWEPGAPGLEVSQEYDGAVFALVVAVAVAGLIAFALVPFPFILAIVAAATFVATQQLVPLLVTRPRLEDQATAFIVVGTVFVLIGLALDVARKRHEAFWWHLVGLGAVAAGLGYHAFRDATWGWIMILVFGIVVLLLATVLIRGTWAVFGVAGFFIPIAHYLDLWFGDLGTAIALLVLGIGLVALGIGARRYGGTWPPLPGRRPAAAQPG
jgi:hypothetical protein